MAHYLTTRDLPEFLSLRDLSDWTGISLMELGDRLAEVRQDPDRMPPPDGYYAGRPFWSVVTVLRWHPLRGSR
jgi:hypothetical protein